MLLLLTPAVAAAAAVVAAAAAVAVAAVAAVTAATAAAAVFQLLQTQACSSSADFETIFVILMCHYMNTGKFLVFNLSYFTEF